MEEIFAMAFENSIRSGLCDFVRALDAAMGATPEGTETSLKVIAAAKPSYFVMLARELNACRDAVQAHDVRRVIANSIALRMFLHNKPLPDTVDEGAFAVPLDTMLAAAATQLPVDGATLETAQKGIGDMLQQVLPILTHLGERFDQPLRALNGGRNIVKDMTTGGGITVDDVRRAVMKFLALVGITELPRGDPIGDLLSEFFDTFEAELGAETRFRAERLVSQDMLAQLNSSDRIRDLATITPQTSDDAMLLFMSSPMAMQALAGLQQMVQTATPDQLGALGSFGPMLQNIGSITGGHAQTLAADPFAM